jgi:hypothetical protein
MSIAYEVLSAQLEDPRNLLVLIREIRRRKADDMKFLIGPFKTASGQWVYPLLRDYMIRTPPYKSPEDTSYTYMILDDGDGLWIINSAGEETGPFPDARKAMEEATALARAEGYTIVEEAAWDEEDLRRYPL